MKYLHRKIKTMALFGLLFLMILLLTTMILLAVSAGDKAAVIVPVVFAFIVIASIVHRPALHLSQRGSLKVRESMDDVKTVMYVHSNATTKDTVYLINGIPMLAVSSALATVSNMFVMIGVIEYAKLSAQEWTGGQKVYWDDGNSRFTTASSGNTLAGVAFEPAANPSATGLIYLSPFLTGTNQMENTIADPGTGVAIPVTASGVCALTIGSAGAETNTLAAPSAIGLQLALTVDTVGTGTRAVTCATTVNQTGNTVMTFAQAGDTILLYSTKVGGALRWKVGSNDGVALS